MVLYKPDPDFERLRTVLLRRGEPSRVPFIELFADREIMAAVLSEPVPTVTTENRTLRSLALDQAIRFWHQCGYDCVTAGSRVDLSIRRTAIADTAALSRGQRNWQDEGIGVISNWQDFEAYRWPRPEEIDYYNIEYMGRHLPEGMQTIAIVDPAGQLETLVGLMGYTGLALALKDNPALVQAVAAQVEEMLLNIARTSVGIPGVAALWLGDDLGFKTATMISPADLHRYVFPCYRRMAEIAHQHGMPFLLHSCGNLREIMDDLIDDIRIDAKHSFEDAIQPVAEAKQEYGRRVALLGGIDVDFLCRADEDAVRAYTRRTVEACAPGGGWALGTGNSVANYIPVRNYLAMLDEGRRCGAYH